MPTIEAQVSPDDLLRAADQLSPGELERFASRVMELLAHRRGASLSPEETDLLQAINQGLPTEIRERYEALVARRREGTLTPDEHTELLRLTDQVEVEDARRAEHLAKLARLRGVSLGTVMDQLGIHAPEYD
jgi:hypothetical protein